MTCPLVKSISQYLAVSRPPTTYIPLYSSCFLSTSFVPHSTVPPSHHLAYLVRRIISPYLVCRDISSRLGRLVMSLVSVADRRTCRCRRSSVGCRTEIPARWRPTVASPCLSDVISTGDVSVELKQGWVRQTCVSCTWV